jgi:hypothetical protein
VYIFHWKRQSWVRLGVAGFSLQVRSTTRIEDVMAIIEGKAITVQDYSIGPDNTIEVIYRAGD